MVCSVLVPLFFFSCTHPSGHFSTLFPRPAPTPTPFPAPRPLPASRAPLLACSPRRCASSVRLPRPAPPPDPSLRRDACACPQARWQFVVATRQVLLTVVAAVGRALAPTADYGDASLGEKAVVWVQAWPARRRAAPRPPA